LDLKTIQRLQKRLQITVVSPSEDRQIVILPNNGNTPLNFSSSAKGLCYLYSHYRY